LHVPRRDIEKFQETSADHHSSTYIESGVGVEGRIMDDKGCSHNVDGPSFLKIELHVPRRELEQNVKEISQNSFGTTCTYIVGSVALEGAVMDLHFGINAHINSSALRSCMWPAGNWSEESSGNF
jgi:hypothetical protein